MLLRSLFIILFPVYARDFVTCITVDRLERDAYPLFRTLRQKYKTSTDRDPVFEEVVLFLYIYIL